MNNMINGLVKQTYFWVSFVARGQQMGALIQTLKSCRDLNQSLFLSSPIFTYGHTWTLGVD